MNVIAKYLLMVLSMYAASVQAQSINRCVASDGKVSYRDTACDANAKSANEVKVKLAPPDARPASNAPNNGMKTDWQKKNYEFESRRESRIRREDNESQSAAMQARQKKADEQRTQNAIDAENRRISEIGAQARQRQRDLDDAQWNRR